MSKDDRTETKQKINILKNLNKRFNLIKKQILKNNFNCSGLVAYTQIPADRAKKILIVDLFYEDIKQKKTGSMLLQTDLEFKQNQIKKI